jgi:hypothetical protein
LGNGTVDRVVAVDVQPGTVLILTRLGVNSETKEVRGKRSRVVDEDPIVETVLTTLARRTKSFEAIDLRQFVVQPASHLLPALNQALDLSELTLA